MRGFNWFCDFWFSCWSFIGVLWLQIVERRRRCVVEDGVRVWQWELAVAVVVVARMQVVKVTGKCLTMDLR